MTSSVCLLPAGECYLMEWSDWSSCVSICVKGAGVDFGSVQARSRAVLAQEPENLQLCPDQVWESQPCTGERGCLHEELLGWCGRQGGRRVVGASQGQPRQILRFRVRPSGCVDRLCEMLDWTETGTPGVFGDTVLGMSCVSTAQNRSNQSTCSAITPCFHELWVNWHFLSWDFLNQTSKQRTPPH